MSSASVLALLLSQLGSAALEVEAGLKPTDAGGPSVGESFVLVIEARHALGEVALLPTTLPLPDALAERPDRRRRTRTREGAEEIDRFELELLAFEAGTLEIPAIEVAVGSTTAHTLPLEILVASNLSADELLVASTTTAEAAQAAMAELEGMAAPDPAARSIGVLNLPLLYGLAGLLAAAALITGLLWWRRHRRPTQTSESPPASPPRPADLVALERLERLAAAGHLQRGDMKSYFVELSEILRVYVGARYGFDSVELTHFELTDALRHFDTPGLDEDELLRLLKDADLVKFAKFRPEPEDAEAAWSRAKDLVLSTRPPPAEAEA